MNNEITVPHDMILQIRDIMNNARFNVAQQVNNEQLLAYWNIGRVIVEHEQDSKERAEYALGGLSNNIFASTYTYVIPEKEKLIAQVEAVLEQWKEKED